MPRPISRRLHGVLDYATGAALIAAPQVLGLDGTRSGRALRAAGAGHAAYSALTRYELGAFRVLPFRAHLAIDAVAAVGLAASPWLLRTRRKRTRHWLPHVLLGAYELTAVALTEPRELGAEEEDLPPQAVRPESGMPSPTDPPDADSVVVPDGAEANVGIGARTVGGGDRAT